jgi:hypothetical protein
VKTAVSMAVGMRLSSRRGQEESRCDSEGLHFCGAVVVAAVALKIV